MNIFQKIFQHRTGTLMLENYCTDILVGLLQKESNYQLLELFVREVLKIKNTHSIITINSQGYYPDSKDTVEGNQSGHSKAFVDIVISSTEFVCFLEMKVESRENKGNNQDQSQLAKYATILSKIDIQNKHLRFCTKYREDKAITSADSICFDQIRWADIYAFFSKYQTNEIIKEFVLFLEMKNMDNKILQPQEIQFAPSSMSLFNKLETIINNINDKLKELELINAERQHLDLRRNRFGLHYRDCLGGTCNLFVGFTFDKNELACQILFWSAKRQTLSKKLLINCTYENSYTDESGWYYINRSISDNESLIEIEGWFVEKINEMAFLKKQNELSNL